MAQRQATCRACGCQLEGRDVYEGICRSCLEDEVLTGAARPRKPKPPAPVPVPLARPPAPVIKEPSPPDEEPPVDIDADTKELVVVGEADAELAPPPPAVPPAPADDPALELGFTKRTPRADRGDDAAAALVLPPDADDELPVVELAGDAALPRREATAIPLAIQVDEPKDDAGYTVALTDVSTGVPPDGDVQPPSVTSLPEPLLRFEDEPAAEAPPRPAPKPQPKAPAEEPPGELRLPLDHPADEPEPPPRPKPRAEADADGPPARLQLDTELDARFRRLESRLVELSARLDALAESRSAGGRGSGLPVFLGVLLALLIFGLLSVGSLALLRGGF